MGVFNYAVLPALLLAQPAAAQELSRPQLPAPARAAAVALWKGLSAGMTPEEVLPVVVGIDGVKKAKVLPPRKTPQPRRLSISLTSEGIAINAMRFELAPVFKDDHLDQVLLAARNQCSANAVSTYAALNAGLQTRFPDTSLMPAALDESEVHAASRASLESGEESMRAYPLANSEAVVLLTFRFKAEGAPAYPSSYSKFGHALWQFAQTEYDHRKAECAGTGNRRMDVVLQYMTRDAFEAETGKLVLELKEKQDELASQL